MKLLKLIWDGLHTATMVLRMALIWGLQQITLFLAPAEVSKVIRQAVRKMREGEEEDQATDKKAFKILNTDPGDLDSTSTRASDRFDVVSEEMETNLIFRDTVDGGMRIELRTDPKRRIVERVKAGEENVVSSPSEAFAMATIRTLVASYPQLIREVTLPVSGTIVPVIYKGHVIIAQDVEGAKREIDAVTSNMDNGSSSSSTNKRMH